MRTRVTMQDVADLAGVSRAAVSRTYTANTSVSPAMRKRVEAAAAELGFHPNALARSLITRHSGLVAVIQRFGDSPFEPYLFTHLSRALQQHGLRTLALQAEDNGELDQSLLDAATYQAEAAIVAAGSVDTKVIERCRQLQLRIIEIGNVSTGDNIHSICIDNRQGIELAVEHLLSRGYQRIGYLGGHRNLYSEQCRHQALLDALTARKMRPVLRFNGDFSVASGTHAADRLVEKHPEQLPLDAIVCGNDAMAIGLMEQLRSQYGIRVPEQLAIIGFDDIPMAAWPSISLTTLHNPVSATIDAVLSALDQPDKIGATTLIAPQLICRSST